MSDRKKEMQECSVYCWLVFLYYRNAWPIIVIRSFGLDACNIHNIFMNVLTTTYWRCSESRVVSCPRKKCRWEYLDLRHIRNISGLAGQGMSMAVLCTVIFSYVLLTSEHMKCEVMFCYFE
jgi:hypothetical protein